MDVYFSIMFASRVLSLYYVLGDVGDPQPGSKLRSVVIGMPTLVYS